jgi:hypothetical protein
MGTTTKLMLLVTAALTTAAIAATSATGHPGATLIRFTVPVSAVRSHGIDVPPKGPSAGDDSQESYLCRIVSAWALVPLGWGLWRTMPNAHGAQLEPAAGPA